jgi:hypothetical protein
MFTTLQLIQLALQFMKIANWITSYISKEEWKKLGYDQAMLEQIAVLQKNTGIAQRVFNETKTATDADLDKELGS